MKQTPAIPVLASAVKVMEAIAAGSAQGPVRKVAAELGISAATCFRIFSTLQQAGWITVDDEGGRKINPELVTRLSGLPDRDRLIQRARPVFESLAQKTQLSVKLSVRDGFEALTILRAESPRAMAISGRTGARFPLAYGSSGAILCAEMSDEQLQQVIEHAPRDAWRNQSPPDFLARVAQARKDGICRDEGSYHAQVYSVSIGVRVGTAHAAITLMGLPDDMQARHLPGYVRMLRAAVGEIEGKP